ncbi:hypothetical protein FRC14_005776, partial [Serendipita sp. 396]
SGIPSVLSAYVLKRKSEEILVSTSSVDHACCTTQAARVALAHGRSGMTKAAG